FALNAGTRSGTTCARAPSRQLAISLMVTARQPTGAGARGLTTLPSGSTSETGRKQPPLVGIDASVSARTAKYAAACAPDGTQLNGPLTCALVPLKSNSIAPSRVVTRTATR